MADPYSFIDIRAEGVEAVRTAFANQVAYCTAANAPITASVVAGILAALDAGQSGALLDRVRGWHGAPLADALPLRVAGGIHALHLSGAEPALAPVYAGKAEDVATVIAAALARHEAALMPWLDGPPQTNEAGRSANFIAAMLWLAEQGLPPHFDCLEIGSSAGINLMLARYRYDLAGVGVGPEDAAMHFAPEWHGSPPPARSITIRSTRGCDVAPVDFADPAQALRLRAYVWPEHHVRFERMDAAVALATAAPPDIVHASAADFIEAELARPQEAGTTRVLMHSIVWQYVPEDQQARVTAAMEGAATRATADRALAWIALESNRNTHVHELVVRHWPGGDASVLLGTAHPHGAWLSWTGGEAAPD